MYMTLSRSSKRKRKPSSCRLLHRKAVLHCDTVQRVSTGKGHLP
uniref:Uncharacterized protein n=1 Tax=Anguilla anguilla TaxID=7936 RepID=A0A0E9WK57_ANGAN